MHGHDNQPLGPTNNIEIRKMNDNNNLLNDAAGGNVNAIVNPAGNNFAGGINVGADANANVDANAENWGIFRIEDAMGIFNPQFWESRGGIPRGNNANVNDAPAA